MTPARLPALPSRSLLDQTKPHRYTNAHSTDVAATMEKYRRLYALQARSLVPVADDSECGEVDAAGTYLGDKP